MSVELNPLALEALENNQRHLDMDGVEVGVSRQALDELITAYKALATQPAREAQEAVAWRYRIFRETNKWTYEHRKAEVDCRRNANYEIEPLYAPPPDAAATIEQLTRQLHNLAVALHRKHYADVPQWRPLPDAEGLLSQIDNMTTGLCRTARAALTTEEAPPQPAGDET